MKAAILFVTLFWICLACDSQMPEGVVQNKKDASRSSTMQNSLIVIREGTVGRIGSFSIGVRSIDDSRASLAIWNTTLPQAQRNDYNVTTKTKTGELLPIGSKLYRVVKVADGDGAAPSGEIQIESEQTAVPEVKFSENTLLVPVNGILELHGLSVEVTAADGKAAEVEIYSNDYPKSALAKKADGIRKISVTAGDEIALGEKKHRVITVHPPQEVMRGLLEISISPI